MKYLELAMKRGSLEESHMTWQVNLLYTLTKRFRPETIVELGTGQGGSFYSFLAGIVENNLGHIYTIDILEKSQTLSEALPDTKFFSKITGDSLSIPDIQNIDFLFIDSNHDLQFILKEWDKWEKNVKVGGLIFFHDVHWEPYGVKEAVEIIWKKEKNRFLRLFHLGAQREGDHCGLEVWIKVA